MKKYLVAAQTFYNGLTALGKVLILVAVLTLGMLVYKGCGSPDPVITHPDANTTNVTLPADNLKTKEVIKYVQDDAEVKRLMAENDKLKRKVTQLSETIATYKATGGGKVEVVTTTLPAPPADVVVVDSTKPGDFVIREGQMVQFKDFRLDFRTDGRQGQYTLTQKFEVLQASGIDQNGKPFNQVKLFEIGPDEKRTLIEDFKTTNIFADAGRAKWRIGFTVQAGAGYFAESGDTTKKAAAGLVGFQWLKKGKTEAAEDSSLAIASPFAILGGDTIQFGVAPVSFNLGRLRFQPFKDLWVSPVVGWDTEKGSVGKVGVGVTASF